MTSWPGLRHDTIHLLKSIMLDCRLNNNKSIIRSQPFIIHHQSCFPDRHHSLLQFIMNHSRKVLIVSWSQEITNKAVTTADQVSGSSNLAACHATPVMLVNERRRRTCLRLFILSFQDQVAITHPLCLIISIGMIVEGRARGTSRHGCHHSASETR